MSYLNIPLINTNTDDHTLLSDLELLLSESNFMINQLKNISSMSSSKFSELKVNFEKENNTELDIDFLKLDIELHELNAAIIVTIQSQIADQSDVNFLSTRMNKIEKILTPYIDFIASFVSNSDMKKQSMLLERLDKLTKLIDNPETRDFITKTYLLDFLYRKSADEENDREEGYPHSIDRIKGYDNQIEQLEAGLKKEYGDLDYFDYRNKTEEIEYDLNKLSEDIECLDGLRLLDDSILDNYDILISEFEAKIISHIKQKDLAK